MNRLYLLFLGLLIASTSLSATTTIRQARRQKPPAVNGLPKKDLRRAHIDSRKSAKEENKDPKRGANCRFKKSKSSKITLADDSFRARYVFDWEQVKVNPEDVHVIFTENWWHEFQNRILPNISHQSYARVKEKFDEARVNFERICFRHHESVHSLVLHPHLVSAIEGALNNVIDSENLADCFELQAASFELVDLTRQ